MKRIYLEITDACNLNCPFCTYEKGHSFMSLEEIDTYTDQIRPICEYLYLHILGEPLLHPRFDEIMDILDQKSFKVQLVTNGTLLQYHPDILQHASLRKLSVSVHSVNHISIEDKYFETLFDLIESDSQTVIELRFYPSAAESGSVAAFKKELIERYGIRETKRKNSFKLKENVYLYYEEMFRWPDLNDPIISFEGTCHGGIDMIAINHDADVTLCCLDPKAFNLLGNLKKDSLADILKSEKYISLCQDLKDHKIRSQLCARCDYRTRFSS